MSHSGKDLPLEIFQIDAFTEVRFRGNPAAVVPLNEWLSDDILMNIAAENNLAETAFFVPQGDDFHLRWFTPATEVVLCGHATLATSFVIFERLKLKERSIRFHTLSGELVVDRSDSGEMTMTFPKGNLECEKRPYQSIPDQLFKSLGLEMTANTFEGDIFKGQHNPNYYVVLEDEEAVKAIQPDFNIMAEMHPMAVVVTAKGRDVDFVSRSFGPSYGIPEDPVTGSTHCYLVPYWAQKLNKTEMLAYQASARGGYLKCRLEEENVLLSGRAVQYLHGTITI